MARIPREAAGVHAPCRRRGREERVPLDFDFDWAVYEGFFDRGGAYSHGRLAAAIEARLRAGDYVDLAVDGELLHCIRTGRHVRAGERVFAFDVLAGEGVRRPGKLTISCGRGWAADSCSAPAGSRKSRANSATCTM